MLFCTISDVSTADQSAALEFADNRMITAVVNTIPNKYHKYHTKQIAIETAAKLTLVTGYLGRNLPNDYSAFSSC